MKLEMHALTDVGICRNHNEDAVGTAPKLGLAILADGMGGYNAGEVASAMAIEVITEAVGQGLSKIDPNAINDQTGFTEASVLLRDAIHGANDAIYNRAQTQSACNGMGTTVLGAIFYGDRVTAAHIGDSRMYRLRANELSHITEDHSVIHEQVRRGLVTAADARNSMIKNLVTRALGVDAGVDPEIVEDYTEAGDIYLLCSDGLTDVVSDETISETLIQYSSDLKSANHHLVELANHAGGPDNISVITVRIRKESKKASSGGLFSRLFSK